MKTLTQVAVALVLMGTPAVAATCDDPFEATGELIELHFRMTAATWDSIRLEKNPGLACDAQYTPQPVEFRCGDAEPWISIGLRHKRGDQRGSDAPQKPPLKLDFNHVTRGQRWPVAWKDLGLRKLTLNNGQANLRGGVLPALLAEPVAWQVMAQDVAGVSRAGWARVFIHFTDMGEERVEYRGIYAMIEDLDRTAMRARNGTSCGALLKSTVGRCRDEVEYDDGSPSESRPLYDTWYSSAPGPDWVDVTERSIELESLLRQEVIRDVLGNGRDSIMGDLYNNSYRWEPRTGRARFYPWDLDWMFAVHPLEIDPTTPLEPSCSPIGLKTRCHPSLRKRYFETACDLMSGSLSAPRLLELWHAADARVRPFVRDESAPVWGGLDPLEPTLTGSYQASVDRMEWWIPQRIDAVRAQAEREGVACSGKCEADQVRDCRRHGCRGEQACVSGAWTVCSVTPGLETCNGADDDCDGVIDEGCDLPKESCAQGELTPRPHISGCGCSSTPSWVLLALVALRRRNAATPLKK